MAQVINTNVMSLNAARNLNRSQGALQTSLQRLSSGFRINSARDDAAGLAISDRMTSQINGLNQAARNANDGVSLAQSAEGALAETGKLLQRMRELGLQSANATNTASDRAALQSEVNQLKSEIDRLASTSSFNGLKLLDGSFTAQAFQVGANANQTITFSIGGASGSDLANNSVRGGNVTTDREGTGSATAAAAAVAANGIDGQTLTISPTGTGTTTDTVVVTAADSAATIAADVNAKSNVTGVTATAVTTATLDNLSLDGTISFTLNGGGTATGISASVFTGDLDNLTSAINDKTGSTGITATNTGGTLTLTQADGKDITIVDVLHSTATNTIDVTGSADGTAVTLGAAVGTDSSTVAGEVTFNSENTFSVASTVADTAGSVAIGGVGVLNNSVEATVASIDISTAAGSNTAINIVDAALNTVNRLRADLGAIQNRFLSTISSLSTQSENVSAARSRIRDTDFAAETAELTRNSILQQAGISMLAQANSQPQNILALLQ